MLHKRKLSQKQIPWNFDFQPSTQDEASAHKHRPFVCACRLDRTEDFGRGPFPVEYLACRQDLRLLRHKRLRNFVYTKLSVVNLNNHRRNI